MNESHAIGCGCVFCEQRDSERRISALDAENAKLRALLKRALGMVWPDASDWALRDEIHAVLERKTDAH